MTPLTTEWILTDPRGMGLVTATPTQRAFCRVLDGLPLGDLANDPDVKEAIGDVDALPVGEPPAEVHIVSSIRVAKSMILAARAISLSQLVDVGGISRGDIVRIVVGALKLDGARPVMSHVLENVQASPLLRRLIIGEPSLSRIVLRHPTGKPIEIVPIPIDRAGGSALSVWLAGVILDEEPRMIGEDDGVKNWDATHDGVAGRILRGGQFVGAGAPWLADGPVFRLFETHFGRPSRDLVILRGRGPAMNPAWWTPARCAELQARNPRAYLTDVLAEFREGGVDVALDAKMLEQSFTLPWPNRWIGLPMGGLDTTSGKGDEYSWAFGQYGVIEPDPTDIYLWGPPPLRPDGKPKLDGLGQPMKRGARICDEFGAPLLNPDFTGTSEPILCIGGIAGIAGAFAKQLSAEGIVHRICIEGRRRGVWRFASDQHEAYANASLFRQNGAELVECTWGVTSKFRALDHLRRVAGAGLLRLENDPILRRQLLELREVERPSGGSLVTGKNGHVGDRAAVVLTLCMADLEGHMRGSTREVRLGGRATERRNDIGDRF